MGRKQYVNKMSAYNASKDVGLYVISDDDVLIENVNSILKRKGIIGVTEPTGSVRYFVDGRHDLTDTADMLQNAVTNFNNGQLPVDEFNGYQIYDYAAHQVFMLYGLDMSLTGTNIIYELVRRVVESGFNMNQSLKEMSSSEQYELMMSYSQIVRNIRYALKQSRLSHMKTKAAIRLLSSSIFRRMRELKGEMN